MKDLSITTIILTYNEQKHIRRCIENIYSISEKIYVVDSMSDDQTPDICDEYAKVELIQNEWPGNQADQFNWALDNLPVNTDWILRLDADEYLSDALIKEVEMTLPDLPSDITGCMLKRDVYFYGKRLLFGKLKPTVLLRLWRKDMAYVEHRQMDEHVVLKAGKSIKLKKYFFDYNLNGMNAWISKHVDYADREARMLMSDKNKNGNLRDFKKNLYYFLPRYVRAWAFFIIRYIFLGGFLDGKPGFLWHFFQCLWYRTLVDVKLDELKDKQK